MEQSILPGNSTVLERTIERAGARIDDLPVPVDTVWRAREIPAEALPWLAWAVRFGFWDDSWSEEKKRRAVEIAPELHRRKGTLSGIRWLLAFGGAELVRAITPPAKTFCAPDWTPEARAEWLSKHPELRVYRRRNRGKRAGAMLARGAAWPNGGAYPAQSDALNRMLPRTFKVRPDGTETELTTVSWIVGATTREAITRLAGEPMRGRMAVEAGGQLTYQIYGPALRGRGAMFGEGQEGGIEGRLFIGARNAIPTDKRAHRRVYITQITSDVTAPEWTLARHTVQPSLEPIMARSEPGFEQGRRQGLFPGAAYPGRELSGARTRAFLFDHYAGSRMFDRTHLFDPAVALPRKGRTMHVGAMKLGMPAYHAEIHVAFRGKRNRLRAWRFTRGYLMPGKTDYYNGLLPALRGAIPKRDKVLLTTITHRPLTAGGNVIAGDDLVAGGWTAGA